MEEINETCYIQGEPGASKVAARLPFDGLPLAGFSAAGWKVAVCLLLLGTCSRRTQARKQAQFRHLHP